MHKSSGYFRGINCPFYLGVLCERPYCHFRHVAPRERDEILLKSAKSNTVNSTVALRAPSSNDYPPNLRDVDDMGDKLLADDVTVNPVIESYSTKDVSVVVSHAKNVGYQPTPISQLKTSKQPNASNGQKSSTAISSRTRSPSVLEYHPTPITKLKAMRCGFADTNVNKYSSCGPSSDMEYDPQFNYATTTRKRSRSPATLDSDFKHARFDEVEPKFSDDDDDDDENDNDDDNDKNINTSQEGDENGVKHFYGTEPSRVDMEMEFALSTKEEIEKATSYHRMVSQDVSEKTEKESSRADPIDSLPVKEITYCGQDTSNVTDSIFVDDMKDDAEIDDASHSGDEFNGPGNSGESEVVDESVNNTEDISISQSSSLGDSETDSARLLTGENNVEKESMQEGLSANLSAKNTVHEESSRNDSVNVKNVAKLSSEETKKDIHSKDLVVTKVDGLKASRSDDHKKISKKTSGKSHSKRDVSEKSKHSRAKDEVIVSTKLHQACHKADSVNHSKGETGAVDNKKIKEKESGGQTKSALDDDICIKLQETKVKHHDKIKQHVKSRHKSCEFDLNVPHKTSAKSDRGKSHSKRRNSELDSSLPDEKEITENSISNVHSKSSHSKCDGADGLMLSVDNNKGKESHGSISEKSIKKSSKEMKNEKSKEQLDNIIRHVTEARSARKSNERKSVPKADSEKKNHEDKSSVSHIHHSSKSQRDKKITSDSRDSTLKSKKTYEKLKQYGEASDKRSHDTESATALFDSIKGMDAKSTDLTELFGDDSDDCFIDDSGMGADASEDIMSHFDDLPDFMYEDQDTIEQCRKIFNETRPAGPSQGSVAAKTAAQEKTQTENVGKKRVAHVAQVDSKLKKVVERPYSQLTPGQVMHNRFLQMQQKALTNVQANKASSSSEKAMASIFTSQKSGLSDRTSTGTGVVVGTASKSEKRIAHCPAVVSLPRPSIPVQFGSKVPTNVRQRYLHLIIDECLKLCATEQEAYDRGLQEEQAVYKRSGNRNIYLNVAVNAIKRLRSEQRSRAIPTSAPSLFTSLFTLSHSDVLGGAAATRVNYTVKRPNKNAVLKDCHGAELYRRLFAYILTEDQLKQNNFPRPDPDNPGLVKLYGDRKSKYNRGNEKICLRCGKRFLVYPNYKYGVREECTYHWGRAWKKRIAGAIESRFSCCDSEMDSKGCQVSKLHVHDSNLSDNLVGFMKTLETSECEQPEDGNYGVYAMDCEMVYTFAGVELARVTVVNSECQPVYESLVKPDRKVIDYNTRFSGITGKDLDGVTTSLREVQAVLLSLFKAKTILVGHSLESDLLAVKLIHSTVVDTSVMFPHRLGPPYKRALRNLMSEHLMKIIQNDASGHDSQEDAAACIQLIQWKLKDDIKKGHIPP